MSRELMWVGKHIGGEMAAFLQYLFNFAFKRFLTKSLEFCFYQISYHIFSILLLSDFLQYLWTFALIRFPCRRKIHMKRNEKI